MARVRKLKPFTIARADVETETTEDALSDKLNRVLSSISTPPDEVLIVSNRRIPVHMKYLTFFTNHFEDMVRNKEGHENEAVIEGVLYEEMLELLLVIYPSWACITGKNVAVVVKLASRFQMSSVLERCKKELMTPTDIRGAQKLLIAQRYNFADLQMELVQGYKSAAAIKKLKSQTEYSQLDHTTRALLLDSITS